MKELNKLTEKLLKQGYTKENYPDYVKPWNDYYGGFEYTYKYHLNMVFKTGCGLLVKGSRWNTGNMAYMGVTWSLENNNPTIRCPYNRVNCEKNHPLLRNIISLGYIVMCCCHETDETYVYEESIDKVIDDIDAYKQRLFEEFKIKKRGRICPEMCRFNEESQKWEQLYMPIEICARRKCQYCTILGRELSTKKGNVFYDVKVIREDTTEGLLNVGDIVTVTKGKRFLDKNCSIDICNIIAEKFKHEIERKYRMDHHCDLYFAKHHGIKFEYEIRNIRAEIRCSRDLEKDLEDIKNGIKVLHESDLIQQDKQIKIENRQKAEQARIKKYRKMLSENGFSNLDRINQNRILKMVKKGIMSEDELHQEPKKKPEQMTLF